MRRLILLPILIAILLPSAAGRKGVADADPLRDSYLDSIAWLGFRLYAGDSILAPDPQRAILLIEEAAREGHPKAANNLAYILTYGPEEMRNPERAFLLYKDAAEAGLPTAMASLADIYRQGGAVKADTAAATHWYMRAAAAGLQDADLKLADMMSTRMASLTTDSLLALARRCYPAPAPITAATALRMAASRLPADNPSSLKMIADTTWTPPAEAIALAILADARARGLGIQYDFTQSLANYLTAARAGDPSAQYIIAETLDMLPDALAPLGVEAYEMDADKDRWYSLARLRGIDDATKAYRRLYLIHK